MRPTDEQMQETARKLLNPTGTAHSPLPWKQDGDDPLQLADHDGILVAAFVRAEDLALAAYFVNVHGGMISLIRQMADAFSFLSMDGASSAAARKFANGQAEQARIYADLFARMGKPDELNASERDLLEWLSKEDYSQYGECCGEALDARGLAQLHPPGEHDGLFIASDPGGTKGIMYRAVSLTPEGRAKAKELKP